MSARCKRHTDCRKYRVIGLACYKDKKIKISSHLRVYNIMTGSDIFATFNYDNLNKLKISYCYNYSLTSEQAEYSAGTNPNDHMGGIESYASSIEEEYLHCSDDTEEITV